MRNLALILIVVFCLFWASTSRRFKQKGHKRFRHKKTGKPNIFFILVDDWGIYEMDLCERKDIHTPNMNRLAREGVFLNNYYVAPLCTPSRTSLLTGSYVHRTGLQHGVIIPSQPSGLPLNFTLMPEYLKNLGYVSRMIGKWHLGFCHKEFTPTYRGFDSHYGFWNGNSDHFTHNSIIARKPSEFANLTKDYRTSIVNPNNVIVDGYDFRRDMEVEYGHEMQFLADVYCEEFMDIIENHDQSDPLFMYMAQHSVHRGNDEMAMKAPYNYTKYFSHINSRERRNMAGSLLAVDICVGKMVSALFEAGMLENSIIIVSSDNGAPLENGIFSNGGSNYPYFGDKGSVFEGGVKVNSFIWSPLIEKPRSVYNGLIHITDWLPTLYSVAGGDVSDLDPTVDGMNLWPALSTGSDSPREEILLLYDTFSDFAGIRWKNYKLVTNYSIQAKTGLVGNRTQQPSSNLAPNDSYCWPPETRLTDEVMNKLYSNRPALNMNNYPQDSQYCKPLTRTINVTIDPKKECTESDKYCLFDLSQDPYETTNIADDEPKIVQYLLKRLEYFEAQAIPAQTPPSDYFSNGYFHDELWVPFCDPGYVFSPPSEEGSKCYVSGQGLEGYNKY